MSIEISKEDSDYLYNVIQKIIDEAGCRMPCSPQEAEGAKIIKGELEQSCDEVAIEPFTCHPRAFLGYIKLEIIIALASLGLFLMIRILPEWALLITLTSVILNIIAFFIIWEEFFNYREFIDILFKKRESQNVVGKIKAKGEKKNIIIFSGHHDSALQFNLLRYFKAGYPIILFIGIGVLFLWIILSVVIIFLALLGFLLSFPIDYNFFVNLATWLLIIIAIPIVLLFFFVTPGERANKVPGAVDNLSAVAIVLGVGRYIKKHADIIPKDTEIQLISFGCEEAGLRGAYRYVERHLEELKKYDAICVNMDGIQSTKAVQVIEFEPTTRTTHSEEVVQKILKASELAEIEIKQFGASTGAKILGQISGGTDATAFSKSGVKAANISAMELKRFINFYHQPTDTLDMIDRGSLEDVLKVCIAFLINESKA